ncbi:DUF805 domain-containing protein [Echinimonas agarilytica]|uniref:DUF805 domain-containing protein n=1 Tax=Echinimonas agarilytica TaxID=1215918 RepID=A0AA42B7Z5_9GAMM|nr:DUF805 domain-containing protein [Echinimonas agarilytica]MCM2679883.1 DUF805 domain-containing protein [Echinimonas agarilytica]
MDYFVDALRKFAVFSGRERRKSYWMFVLFYLIFYIVAALIDQMIGGMTISTIFTLLLLVPSISISARRLHDTGRTGWWQLIGLIPLVGMLVLIFFYCQDSDDGANDYGANPKL